MPRMEIRVSEDEVRAADVGKVDIIHDEKAQDITAITSAFANLTYAGYAASVIGSIIANEGFIRQFATVTDSETGARVLASTHV
ncbi:hypothetical protein VD0002_g1342 [Verticillium dahliae]|uniref:Uncharacterized protein n=1 Tax=Verticillium dahliae TaxID=27337 RepID=A0AA44WMI1_VERDA|nr:hypothetical protein BJF96_g3254 [Verticillium dahliae]PNH53578.1 hypothetical protein VD0003_g3827 [Verticillium dahliae]PNH68772.1 hypothetical protein VD0002_g1342 [Verticillium dahliae]